MRALLAAALVLITGTAALAADPSPFRANNPDVDKVAFARDFITGVSYFKRVWDRQTDEEKLASSGMDEIGRIRRHIDYRTLDNTEIRIARNYLNRYKKSRNPLIVSVARRAAEGYDAMLLLSNRERELWQVLLNIKRAGRARDIDEKEFMVQQRNVARARKEAGKQLLAAAWRLRVVLLSAERCPSEDCHALALTARERDKLAGLLDGFARDNLQWGLKEGQSTFDGIVALIREILEDPLYTSAP